MQLNTRVSRSLTLAASVGLSLTLAAGCASDTGGSPQPETGTTATAPKEQASATPRLAVSYDGGVLILDATTLDTVDETEIEGFTRLNPAGNGRHVIISSGEAFKVLDTGTWSSTHDDHTHYYTTDPAMTDVEFAANEPGHVVRHAGKTVLFNDGSGLVEIFDPIHLAKRQPRVETYTTPEPHHGVAVALADGNLLTTIGNSESRNGIALLDGDRKEILRNEQCPGVHGEAVAAGETIVLGCQDGLLVYKDDAITKVQSPDPYGRIGNQAGSEESEIVLGDYKSDPTAELERPQRISLTNTWTSELKLVDLGTSYTFRSLGRGPHGEALVLGTDGAIHVIDPHSGAVINKIAVIDEWTEPTDWQEPRPALFVSDHTAYVTDPASKKLIAVDLEDGTIAGETTLDHTPNELTGVTG
ncbi:zinc metallochaperone AztD [Rhodococcus sp. IEGM 1379]|uniref:zinc metallochaperone AztD n=1 Tax=Rhodococcus sp. IEGM 1379 TaxID=3047086 RepID=UPI0024B6A2CC|nr:zinc metallochaperone AztD [Rhodococcus sp. IEGM 1379]MDI9913962.1 zinc metallochaperone AztD [Rhodococcus sp. IEGM 1379]